MKNLNFHQLSIACEAERILLLKNGEDTSYEKIRENIVKRFGIEVNISDIYNVFSPSLEEEILDKKEHLKHYGFTF